MEWNLSLLHSSALSSPADMDMDSDGVQFVSVILLKKSVQTTNHRSETQNLSRSVSWTKVFPTASVSHEVMILIGRNVCLQTCVVNHDTLRKKVMTLE